MSRHIFQEYSHTKLHDHVSSGGHADRQTDMMAQTVAFRHFAKAPKNWNTASMGGMHVAADIQLNCDADRLTCGGT